MITVFPVDAQNNQPTYTADQYRKATSIYLPYNGRAFGTYQAVRQYPTVLVSMDGLQGRVHEHAGVLCPWADSSPYHYALVGGEQFAVESSSQSYKIAVVVSDPAAGHGSSPGASVQVYPMDTPDANIDGMVIATVVNGVANDIAPILGPDGVYVFRSFSALESWSGKVAGTRAMVTGDPIEVNNGLYTATAAGAWIWADKRQQVLPQPGGWNCSGIITKEIVRSDVSPFWYRMKIDPARYQRTAPAFTIGRQWLPLFPNAIPLGFRPKIQPNGDVMRATDSTFEFYPSDENNLQTDIQLQASDDGTIKARSIGADVNIPRWAMINVGMKYLVD